MKTFRVVGTNLLNLTAALAFALVVASCGDDQPIVPVYNPGGGYGGYTGVCGAVQGYPIDSRSGTAPYYANLYSQSGYSSSQSTMNISVAYAGQSSNSVVGSAQIYMQMPNSYSTTPVCVNSRDLYTGQNFMGQGYPVSDSYGNYFIIQQLTMKGSMQTQLYGSIVPTPVTVEIGTVCQSYLDLTNRKFYGCVTVNVGGQQTTYFRAQ